MDKELPLVSVIVPVYNVQDYLAECINSIIRQNYTHFELLLVDDGSTDYSGMLCEQYRKKDNRIKVIKKKNGGLSDARNYGIDKALGEYLTFIDSDDYVSEIYLNALVNTAIHNNADIVQVEFTREKNRLASKSAFGNKIYNPTEALKSMLTLQRVQVNAWAKLYHAKLFDGVRYPVGKINEDNLTTYKTLIRANKVVCCSDYLYYYRVNPAGIMNSQFNEKRFDILNAPDETAAFLGSQSSQFKEELEYYRMRIAMRLYNECLKSGVGKTYSFYLKKIESMLKGFNVRNKYCSLKYRTLIFLISHLNSFYRTVAIKAKR